MVRVNAGIGRTGTQEESHPRRGYGKDHCARFHDLFLHLYCIAVSIKINLPKNFLHDF
jgi:hypothetical protein